MLVILRPNENLITKTCKCCGLVFRTDNPRVKLCPSCKQTSKARQREKDKEQKKKLRAEKKKTSVDLSLHKLMAILVKYNTEHGTNYTYGQFVQELNNGSIKLEG